MNKNLSDYVKVYNNFFDQEFCKETITQLKNAEFVAHQYHQSYFKTTSNLENELSVSRDRIDNSDKIMKNIWNGLQRYISDLNFPWYYTWKGYFPIRYNRYDENTLMREHCDHISTLFSGDPCGVPILSIVGVLNEDYEGGNFVMCTDEVITLKTGDLMIFPSNFLYPHKVETVTKGTRYSFVSWVF